MGLLDIKNLLALEGFISGTDQVPCVLNNLFKSYDFCAIPK